MAYNNLRVEQAGGVVQVTLARPVVMNALSLEAVDELIDVLRGLDSRDGARALLISGEGRAFCAGADLSAGADASAFENVDAGAGLESHFNPLIRALSSQPLPVVCAVHGFAAGAGASLALACDFVIAARTAYFLQAFVHIGLIPDAGANWTLPRLVGKARALGMMMLGDRIPAAQAAEWGLIWQCVDDAELTPAAEALAARLAAGPTRTYNLIRQSTRLGMGMDLEATLEAERKLQKAAGKTRDFQEGVTAFLEKRRPEFSGR